jgi:hypothetical protein
MGSAKFTIGTKEKHVVVVDYSDGLWYGRVKVEVDDKELTDSQHWWLGPRKYQFNVGDSEPHKVELRIGTLGHKFELFVDGKIEGSA